MARPAVPCLQLGGDQPQSWESREGSQLLEELEEGDAGTEALSLYSYMAGLRTNNNF